MVTKRRSDESYEIAGAATPKWNEKAQKVYCDSGRAEHWNVDGHRAFHNHWISRLPQVWRQRQRKCDPEPTPRRHVRWFYLFYGDYKI